jgi:hypothetical protein
VSGKKSMRKVGGYDSALAEIAGLIESARRAAARSVNRASVEASASAISSR